MIRRATLQWGILRFLWGLHSLAAHQQGAMARQSVSTLEEKSRFLIDSIHIGVLYSHHPESFFLHFFMCSLTAKKCFIFLCFFHSRLSATPDSVTSSICALSEGRRTRPETAVTAKEENPGCKRRERYVRYCKLPKQGLYETNTQAIEGQVKWVRFCRSVHI